LELMDNLVWILEQQLEQLEVAHARVPKVTVVQIV
jgi:hypothetical protein